MPNKLSFVLLGPLLFLALTKLSQAQTVWTAQTGDWFTATNWSAGVPSSTTDAQIINGGTAQITTGAAAANTLEIGVGSPDETSGTLMVSGPASIDVTDSVTLGGFGFGTLMILDGGVVNSASAGLAGSTHFGGEPGEAMVTGQGSTWSIADGLGVGGGFTIQDGGAVSSGSLDIDGVVALDGVGSIATTGKITVGASQPGFLAIQNGAVLTSDGVTFVGGYPATSSVLVDGAGSEWNNDFDQARLTIGFGNPATLTVSNGGTVSTFLLGISAYDGSESSVTIDGTNSALNVRTTLIVGGFDLGDGASAGGVAPLEISHGAIVTSGNTTVFGRGSIIDDSILTNNELTIDVGGSLSGNGTVTGDVTTGGTVQPGDPVETLALQGDFTQSSTGTLVAEISGPGPTDHDFLSITGDATIDGTLEVRFIDGFLPTAGQVFDLISVGGSISGNFSRITFPDLASGFQFSGKFVSGTYQLTAMNDGASAIGLRNISTRGQVAPGDDALIAGFIVTGHDDKQVIIRGLGPSLTANGVALPGRLADPTLELHDSTGALLSSNDNWMDSPDRQAIIDSMIPPNDDAESAIVATLAPGSYTAILRGVADSSGIGVVEVYDLSPAADATLGNISTRGFVGTGDQVMIGGFIADDQSTPVLVRALGPSLTFLGIDGALADPTLELHNSDGELIASNNDWLDTDQAEIENTGIPPTNPAEAAILTTLDAGNYTAIISGEDGGTGIGLLEIYNLR